MTVGEFIKELTFFEADKEIEFYNEEVTPLEIIEIGFEPSLPYVQFKRGE